MSSPFFFQASSCNLIVGGNLGVGTDTPRAKLEVNGHILPSACNVYDLGSSTLRFRDLYLSSNSIDMEGTKISINSSGLVINGAELVPPGTVMYFASSTAPTGWLKCNGNAISRSTYGKLFTAISTTWGVGDGSTTFNVPELRGEFLRSWDDGRTVDNGRAFASSQGNAMIRLYGTAYNLQTSSGGGSADGIFTRVVTGNPSASGSSYRYMHLTFDSEISAPSASEIRPRNMALLACIKT